ncbi:MAG: hypothetical protein ABII18_02025, partial [bacterium]
MTQLRKNNTLFVLKLTLVFSLWSLVFTSCSTFYGGTTSSEGDMSVSASPTEIAISGDAGTTSHRTITFSNASDQSFEIHNMAFVDNDCGAYSVYNVLDEANNVLYQTGNPISISVVSGASISINLQFSPTSCKTTEYTTTFIIYYMMGETELSDAVSLFTTVTDNAPDAVVCDEVSRSYYDEYDNPTERSLPVLADGKSYYLRIDKLSAYIQTTGAFAAYATQVSTHLYLDVIPEADRYQPVYLPFTTDESGNVTVVEIDACSGFGMPTPITDTFFLAAPVAVNTAEAFIGSIDRAETPGRFSVPNIVLRMSSYINNSNSLLQSTEGYFDVNINVASLTSGETASNDFLLDVPADTDDDGEPLLNIVDDKLVGKDIRHGTVTLVGIGEFIQDDNTKLSNEAVSAIIDNESYLFIQIEGVVTQE